MNSERVYKMFEMKDFSLEGKIALVTGASYGIGFGIATAYAKAGATIVFNDINQDLVNKGLAAYKEEGIEAHGYVCDVTNEEAVAAFIKQVEEEVGVIDILVNNAGIIKRIPMLEMSAADFRQVIDIDLNGPFIMAKAVLPGMMKKNHGKIINICSMMSELGRETVSGYAAAKGGIPPSAPNKTFTSVSVLFFYPNLRAEAFPSSAAVRTTPSAALGPLTDMPFPKQQNGCRFGPKTTRFNTCAALCSAVNRSNHRFPCFRLGGGRTKSPQDGPEPGIPDTGPSRGPDRTRNAYFIEWCSL